jgi:phosphoglycerate dehydrogenase-like enzyme
MSLQHVSTDSELSVQGEVHRFTGTLLLLGPHDDTRVERVRRAAPAAEVVPVTTLEAGDLLAGAEVVAGSVPESLFGGAPGLRWLHSWAAGPDADLHEGMRASDVVLTSSAGNGAIPLAEHAMMLALILNRDYPRWARAQAEHRWDRFTHAELAGQTLGIHGVGNSGSDLALKAKAFHMDVVGLRRNPSRAVEGVDRMFAPDQLHEFLAVCDVVVVTAPLTEETRGVLDDAAFAAMKDTAHLVVFSRGGIVDDAALLRALADGRIAAAALDAHSVEPLPADSPFWDLPNVVVTPHNGATTARTAQRGFEIFLDNLRRYDAGEPLRNVVDKTLGY